MKKVKVEKKVINEFLNTNEEKEIFSWQAPERSIKRRDKDFWLTVVTIYVLSSIILFFAKEIFLVFAIGAAIFLYYALSTVEPQIIVNKITNRGIYFGQIFYAWVDLANFWFGETSDKPAIYFETYLRLPRQICLIINETDKNKLKDIVIQKLPLVKPTISSVDKMTKWLAEKLPLEEKKSVGDQTKK